MDSKQQSQVTLGVVLIVIGLVFLAQQLQLAVGLNIGRLWPLVLIVIGVSKLGTPDAAGRRGRQGHMLVMVGAIFLLHTFHILRLGDSWPLFIVAGGITMLFSSGQSCGSKGRTHAG